MATNYIQEGPTPQTRPTLTAKQVERRNSANTAWEGASPEDLLTSAGGDVGVNGHKVVNVADPTNPQDADTKAARDTAISAATAGIANGPSYAVGTLSPTDATPTLVPGASVTLATGKVAALDAVVTFRKSDLSVVGQFRVLGTFVNTAGTVTQVGDGTVSGAASEYLVSPPQQLAGAFTGSLAFQISGTSVGLLFTGMAATSFTVAARLRSDVN